MISRISRIRGVGAFTLIEVVGAMAVVAIMALALVTVLIKQLDRIAWEKETKQLKALAEAFRKGVLITKTIPNQTTWEQFIATNAGLETIQVRVNDRRLTRVFLIDPAFQIDGTSGLNPYYVQTVSGALNLPISPRLMIISSIAKALPTNVVTGVAASTTAFNNIWDAAEGSIPAGWVWNGRGEDLKVQRMHLGDMFLRLELNRDQVGGSGGRYSIESGSVIGVPGGGPDYSRYFIDGTHLRLFDDAANLEYSEILHRGRSFYFVLGTWRSERFLGRTVDRPGPIDLERAAAKFMGSRTNTCAANDGVTTWTVRDAMIGFMSNYVGWCEAGFPISGNNTPSGTYGSVLGGQQNQFGSQAYMNAKTTALICQQAQ